MKSAKGTLPQCRTKCCRRRVPSKRSELCLLCRHKKAVESGGRSSGNAMGNPGNAGNQKKGVFKKAAGKRSGLKRSSKYCLVVKKRWLDRILDGSTTLEIRGCSTLKRGWIHLAQSKSGGKLVGRARLVDCKEVPRSSFMKYRKHHAVVSLTDVPYRRIYAWVLEQVERFKEPLAYTHPQGAVIWIRLGLQD